MDKFKKIKKYMPLIYLGAIILALIIALIIYIISVRQKERDNSSIQENILEYAGISVEEVETAAPEELEEVSLQSKETATPALSTSLTEKQTKEPNSTMIPVASPTPYIPEMESKAKKYAKVKFNKDDNLSCMLDYYKQNNLEALDDLSHLDRYIAMSYSLNKTDDFLYYGDVNSKGEPDGVGAAVYADNQYYFGEWKNGVREGKGLWVHYHIHFDTNLTDKTIYHSYGGEFKNDLPNGSGQDHYEFDSAFLQGTDRYINNYIGTYKDGYVDGEIYCTITTKQEKYADFEGTAINGSFTYLSESRDKQKKGPVMVNRENPDDYLWMSDSENRFIGVESYISKHKK